MSWEATKPCTKLYKTKEEQQIFLGFYVLEKETEHKCKVAEICPNRTAGRNQFFQKSSAAQIEKCPTNES